MMVLLVFIALVGAYVAGMVNTMCLVRKISPAAYFALQQDIKWRKAEAAMNKETEDDEEDEC